MSNSKLLKDIFGMPFKKWVKLELQQKLGLKISRRREGTSFIFSAVTSTGVEVGETSVRYGDPFSRDITKRPSLFGMKSGCFVHGSFSDVCYVKEVSPDIATVLKAIEKEYYDKCNAYYKLKAIEKEYYDKCNAYYKLKNIKITANADDDIL